MCNLFELRVSVSAVLSLSLSGPPFPLLITYSLLPLSFLVLSLYSITDFPPNAQIFGDNQQSQGQVAQSAKQRVDRDRRIDGQIAGWCATDEGK